MSKQDKSVPLDALRGMAAVIVVAHHFLLAFLPQYHGILSGTDPSHTLLGTPGFFFINGTGMVVIFFVLSGHVLSRRALSADPLPSIMAAAIKRWFRLMPLVLISVLVSYLFFVTGAYHYQDAAPLSGSEWLATFGFSGLTQDYAPSLFYAVAQGAVLAFVKTSVSFNTSLWTMTPEFYGSMLVFAVSALLALRGRRSLFLALVLLALVLVSRHALYLAFLLGVMVSVLEPARWRPGPALTLALLAGGIYLCGYYFPIGAYGWAGAIPFREPSVRFVIMEAGAFLLVIVFASDNLVSRRFHGSVARLLGKASFPLYVIHCLIITSFSSWAFTAAGGGGAGVGAAGLVLVLVVPAMVAPLIWIDDHWLGRLENWRWPHQVWSRLQAWSRRPRQVTVS